MSCLGWGLGGLVLVLVGLAGCASAPPEAPRFDYQACRLGTSSDAACELWEAIQASERERLRLDEF